MLYALIITNTFLLEIYIYSILSILKKISHSSQFFREDFIGRSGNPDLADGPHLAGVSHMDGGSHFGFHSAGGPHMAGGPHFGGGSHFGHHLADGQHSAGGPHMTGGSQLGSHLVGGPHLAGGSHMTVGPHTSGPFLPGDSHGVSFTKSGYQQSDTEVSLKIFCFIGAQKEN